jgi:hypothetical protein
MSQFDTEILPSGRVVKLAMPPLYSILATVGGVPSQIIMDALAILTAEGVHRPKPIGGDDLMARQIRYVRGLYAIAALCLVSPTLVLDREPDPAANEIGQADLTWADVEAVYYGYFRGYTRTAHQTTPPRATPDDGGDTCISPTGDDVGA